MRTTAVGMYPQDASQPGAPELSGNVLEWCSNLRAEPRSHDVSRRTAESAAGAVGHIVVAPVPAVVRSVSASIARLPNWVRTQLDRTSRLCSSRRANPQETRGDRRNHLTGFLTAVAARPKSILKRPTARSTSALGDVRMKRRGHGSEPT